MDIVFLGPPGAGKGTQARSVSGILGYCHLSTGDLLRAAIRDGGPIGAEARPYLDRGQLVPDQLVDRMVEAKLGSDECRKGALLDGYPRNLTQARVFDETEARLGRKVGAVVLLEVPDAVLEARLSGRRTCPNCKALYHVTASPPRSDMTCDTCGEALVLRSDDRLEVVRERLQIYHRETEPIVEHYRSSSIVSAVAGTGNIEAVTASVLKALGRV